MCKKEEIVTEFTSDWEREMMRLPKSDVVKIAAAYGRENERLRRTKKAKRKKEGES